MCARAATKNTEPSAHKCFKNWNGSSSGMEADIIVEGFSKSIELYGVKFARFIGDGDSNVYKKILDSRPYIETTVEKVECKNHLLRNMCNKIKDMVKNPKFGKVTLRKLIGDRILRIRMAVTMAIRHRQNETSKSGAEKIKGLRDDILNIPFHVFGNHEKCDSYFCSGKEEKNYIPLLNSCGLLSRLMELMNSLGDHSRSLLHNANNNAAEEYNSIIAKFVGGKRINYCLKRSYQARCNAAVVSHNSRMPVYNLHKTMYNCSPGRVCKNSEERRNKRRIYGSDRKKMCKRRRLFTDADNSSYGNNVERPDLELDLYEIKKDYFVKKLKLSKEERHKIMEETIIQRLSHVWLEERRKRLTASNFGYVCNKLPHTYCNSIVKKILYSNFDTSAMQYGRQHEKDALDEVHRRNIKTKPSGLFIDEEFPFLAASPDGLINDDGILEIKCPSSCSNLSPEEGIQKRKITFWSINKKNKTQTVNKKHIYYYQIQGQLQITKRKYCLFVVWTPKGTKIEKIERDEAFWKANMQEKLTKFYFDCLLPEIIDPRYPRKLPIRNPEYIKEAREIRKLKLDD